LYVKGSGFYHFPFSLCQFLFHTKTTPKVGTLMEGSPLPYKTWLWAIYLVAADKRGISAMSLMRQLHLSYKTAWYLLHRIREAMGNRDEKYLLQGIVEFDDSYFGGPKGGGKRGRGTKKTKVLQAVSKDAEGKPKFLKMWVVPNLKGPTVGKFAAAVIAEGATVETDAARSYRKALSEKYNHNWDIFDADKEMLAWLHIIVSNAKAHIQGTYHGIDEKYLQRYLNEFGYRFNRRFQQPSLFDRLLAPVTDPPPLGLVALKG
jgi:transposase-like protein